MIRKTNPPRSTNTYLQTYKNPKKNKVEKNLVNEHKTSNEIKSQGNFFLRQAKLSLETFHASSIASKLKLDKIENFRSFKNIESGRNVFFKQQNLIPSFTKPEIKSIKNGLEQDKYRLKTIFQRLNENSYLLRPKNNFRINV